ncbi:hypothetical protein NHX12_008295, partial [Muraenolepis orangiensis]
MQLTLESLDLQHSYVYPIFILGTLTYGTILFLNTMVFATILFTKTLHKPMFILLLNLPIMDIIGTSAVLPQLLQSIVSYDRSISYPGCFFQAILVHFYGTGNFLFLTAMAYDRFRICKTQIVDIFCNNPSLNKLLCDDTRVNNFFGMAFIVIIQGGPMVIVIFTYIQILVTCVKSRTLTYGTILFLNTMVFATILFTKTLHKPMFILLLNLPIMDIIGTSAVLPQLLQSIVSYDRSISYPGCFFQAILVHFYGTGNFFFLTAMAYD